MYVGEFRANLVVYRFCEVISYKKWTLVNFSTKGHRHRQRSLLMPQKWGIIDLRVLDLDQKE